MKKFIVLIIFFVPYIAFSSDYDDCILKNMKGSNSNVSAYKISETCKNMTTPDACKGKNLIKFKNVALNKKIEFNNDKINNLKNKVKKLKVLDANFNKKCYGLGKSTMECESGLYIEIISNNVDIEILSSVSDGEVLSYCLDYCSNQSYFSKKFGECKTDW